MLGVGRAVADCRLEVRIWKLVNSVLAMQKAMAAEFTGAEAGSMAAWRA
jgi:hypothetical protein